MVTVSTVCVIAPSLMMKIFAVRLRLPSGVFKLSFGMLKFVADVALETGSFGQN